MMLSHATRSLPSKPSADTKRVDPRVKLLREVRRIGEKLVRRVRDVGGEPVEAWLEVAREREREMVGVVVDEKK
jgi:hypothetical protein